MTYNKDVIHIDEAALVGSALSVRRQAYAPYSHYPVGAALLSKSGKIFTGCNVENISFGLTICAEQAAISAAVAAGEREFAAIAVAADSKTGVLPCGRCRQTLAEFGDRIMVYSCTLDGKFTTAPLGELLPGAKLGIGDLSNAG
jgi:cytidine deaminase